MKRRGKFRISTELMESPSVWEIFAWLEFVPIRVYPSDNGAFTEFVGYSKQFDEVEKHITPLYDLTIRWEENQGRWFDARRIRYNGEKA